MEIKERKDMDPAYMWDLSTLYASDEAWKEDLGSLKELLDHAAAFQGKLKDAGSIAEYFKAETELELKLSDLYCYAELRNTEDMRDETAQTMLSMIEARYAEVVSRISFAEPEILALPEEVLSGLASSPELKDYAFTVEKLITEKPHVLSKESEALLAGFSEVFRAPAKIAENLQNADLLFQDAEDQKGEKHEVTQANYILLQQSGDRTLREGAFRSFYQGYQQHINTFAAAYSGCVKATVQEARVRHYGSSREMSMAGEHIPVTVYDSLIEAVHRFMPAMHRYAALRKKLLGLKELHYYDLYAPLTPGLDRTWTYQEAQDMVLSAVAPLGDEYVERVRDAFRDRWIDVYPNKGKQGGAFSSGTYHSNPFILTSFTGDYNSVTTIAHEMGHSQHTWLANHHQPAQYAEYTLFVAEVASTVNENLLVEQLLKKTTDRRERLFLLNQYLEGFKGTVYRQTMFAEFEKLAHAMAERGEALTPGALNTLYHDLTVEYFGPALVMDDEVKYEWARIPHFYRPFYVYKYATSYSAAVAISEKILSEGSSAAQKYLDFLSLGGSQYPLDELKQAGVDLTTSAPVEDALRKFESILDEAENL